MNSVDDKKHLDILYDHYKDTFTWVRSYISSRDQLLFLILLVLAVMLLQIFSPRDSGAILSKLISTKLGFDAPINPAFVASLLWFALLALAIKYFQIVWIIEKQYEYIHRLEESLSETLTPMDRLFSREGAHYLRNYPLFSEWSHYIYTMVFPLLLVTVIVLKIKGEFVCWKCSAIFYVDWFMFAAISISIVLYLRMLHFKK